MPMVVPKDNSSTQWMDFSLRALNTEGSAGSLAGAKISPEYMMHGYAAGHHWDKWLEHSS